MSKARFSVYLGPDAPGAPRLFLRVLSGAAFFWAVTPPGGVSPDAIISVPHHGGRYVYVFTPDHMSGDRSEPFFAAVKGAPPMRVTRDREYYVLETDALLPGWEAAALRPPAGDGPWYGLELGALCGNLVLVDTAE